jgi:hypothetical protein
MARFGRRDPPAITASSVRVERTRSGDDIQRLRQAWQDRAMGYYDIVPEVWFASQFYARGLGKIRMFPAIRSEDGEIEPAEDAQLSELFDRVQDPGGGRTTMSGSYGRLMFLTGECYLLATAPEGEEVWEIVSTREITVNTDGSIIRVRTESGQREQLKPLVSGDNIGSDQCIIYRMWRRHPRKSSMADAPLRASLDICEELVLLTLGIRARIRSRLSGAGILAIDADVTLPAAEESDDSDEDAFIRTLGEHLMEPIGDEGSASAVVPYLMRIPTAGRKISDLIQHIKVHDPNEEFPERGMRQEAVQRLATGLDLPPEVLLGLSGANHWTSWQIDEQSWELLQPTVQQWADDLAGAYLRPAAKDIGYDNWMNVTLAYDEAEVVTRPDRTKDASMAHDRLVLSDAAYREAGGWQEEDAPSEEEWLKRVGIKIRDPGLIPGGTPAQPTQSDSQAPPQEPPAEPPGPTQPSGASMIAGAAEFAVERARELAGSRIRTRSKQCGPCQAAINGYPNSLVAAVLGPSQTTATAGEEIELVRGAGEGLARLLTRRGVDTETATRLGVMVEEHAANTLYLAEPPPLRLEEVLT